MDFTKYLYVLANNYFFYVNLRLPNIRLNFVNRIFNSDTLYTIYQITKYITKKYTNIFLNSVSTKKDKVLIENTNSYIYIYIYIINYFFYVNLRLPNIRLNFVNRIFNSDTLYTIYQITKCTEILKRAVVRPRKIFLTLRKILRFACVN